MDRHTFNNEICKYTHDEYFYKKYHIEKKNKDTFKSYLDSIDLNMINDSEHPLYVPELNFEYFKNIGEEKGIFYNHKNKDILVLKHERFTPAFMHEHTIFEIVYVYKGHCKNTICGNEIIMKEGDLCFISPNTKHSILVNDDSIILNLLIRTTTFQNAFFPLLISNSVISSFFTKALYSNKLNNFLLFATNKDDIIKNNIIDLYIEHVNNSKYSNQIMHSMLMLLFGNLLRHHETDLLLSSNVKKNTNKIISILKYIEEHYSEISLQELADHFYFSPSHLSKLIKEYTGKTFIQTLQNIKLGHACSLLINTELNLGEICAIVGYANVEHFERTFKKEFKLSPIQYRNNHKN